MLEAAERMIMEKVEEQQRKRWATACRRWRGRRCGGPEAAAAEAADVSFSCVVKHKDDGQTKFIKPNSQRQDIIIKYWVSIGSIHREQG